MEGLISEVQKRNVLWNKRNPRYKDRLTVEKEWNSVAESTGLSKEDARKQWRNMRDRFIKEFRKIPKNKSGDSQDFAATYPGKWQYFTDLLFLRDSVLPRSTEGNVSVIETSSDTQSSNVGSEGNEEELWEEAATTQTNDDITPTNLDEIEPLPSKTTSNVSKKKRPRENNEDSLEQKLLDLESKKIALLEASEDENSLFLRSLLPYFKRMDPLQQLRIRNKFQEILMHELSISQTSSRRFSNASYSMSPSSVAPIAQSRYPSTTPPSPTNSVCSNNPSLDDHSNFNSTSYVAHVLYPGNNESSQLNYSSL